jgi:hypothetical protein
VATPEHRRFLVCLTALAVLCAVTQAVTGIGELVLYLTPAFLIGALVLSGHFVGEEKILARWRAATAQPHRLRRCAQRWRPRAIAPIVSLHEQGSFGVRGPPALLAPAA